MDLFGKPSSLDLANTFLARHAGDVGIQHMKLQKLCYYAYGWWLSAYDQPLTMDKPEVWKYGPVFSGLYAALRGYGTRFIREPISKNFKEPAAVITAEEELRLIDWIWGRYGRYSSERLSDMTHQQGTPWRRIAEQFNFSVPEHYVMPDQEIRAYFRSAAAQKEVA